MPTIYLTHTPQAYELYFGEPALTCLQKLGKVVCNQDNSEPTSEALVQAAQDCDIIVAFRIPAIPAYVFDQLPKLAAVCRVAVDVRNIDISAASRHGILVTRATPGFGPSVAEWIVGAMIALSRSICASAETYHAGQEPRAMMGSELRYSTLGVIGYGTIGQYLCRLARAFGMRILVHDPYVSIDEDGIEQVDFKTLLNKADFITCLAPATEETQDLMDRDAFAQMRHSAYFINASRGNLVNEDALKEALDEGIIAGAALDVGMTTDQCPPMSLASHPRVIATPHIGGLTRPAVAHQAMDAVNQVTAILAGRTPPGAINADRAWRTKRLYEQVMSKESSTNDD